MEELVEDAVDKLNLPQDQEEAKYMARVVPQLGSLEEVENTLVRGVDDLTDNMKQIASQTKVGWNTRPQCTCVFNSSLFGDHIFIILYRSWREALVELAIECSKGLSYLKRQGNAHLNIMMFGVLPHLCSV